MLRKQIGLKNSPKVVGAGLVTLDIIINNGAKTPIFSAGGTCGNVLAGLSFLGWESISISRAGMDLAGEILTQDLIGNGVDVAFITEEEDLHTPRIVERLYSNGQYAKHDFLLRCPTCHAYLPRFRSPRIDLVDDILSKHKNPDVYIFDRVTSSTLKMARNYRENGALIFFEPTNLRYLNKLEGAIRLCHILKYAGNEIEGNDKVIKRFDDDIIREISAYSPTFIIQTLGKHGLLFRSKKASKWQYQESFKLNEVYDFCGAGDWCTIGFLFYLQKLARQNNIKLLETLEFNEFINSALSFSQILASLSCMFIGARGLSNSIDQKRILEIVYACMKKKVDQSLILSKEEEVEDHQNKIDKQKRLDENNACPICLLT